MVETLQSENQRGAPAGSISGAGGKGRRGVLKAGSSLPAGVGEGRASPMNVSLSPDSLVLRVSRKTPGVH